MPAAIAEGPSPQAVGAQVPEQSAKVAALLKEFADVFPEQLPSTLPPARGVEHAIELKPGSKPPPPRPLHHVSPKDSAVIEEYVRTELSVRNVLSYKLTQFEPVAWAEELLQPARAADHRYHGGVWLGG